MQNRQRKIVGIGAVLIAASFLMGLFHSALPLVFLHFALICFDLFVFFCYGLFGIVFLGIAATVFAISTIFINPFGLMFMLGTLWLVVMRKPKLTS